MRSLARYSVSARERGRVTSSPRHRAWWGGRWGSDSELLLLLPGRSTFNRTPPSCVTATKPSPSSMMIICSPCPLWQTDNNNHLSPPPRLPRRSFRFVSQWYVLYGHWMDRKNTLTRCNCGCRDMIKLRPTVLPADDTIIRRIDLQRSLKNCVHTLESLPQVDDCGTTMLDPERLGELNIFVCRRPSSHTSHTHRTATGSCGHTINRRYGTQHINSAKP